MGTVKVFQWLCPIPSASVLPSPTHALHNFFQPHQVVLHSPRTRVAIRFCASAPHPVCCSPTAFAQLYISPAVERLPHGAEPVPLLPETLVPNRVSTHANNARWILPGLLFLLFGKHRAPLRLGTVYPPSTLCPLRVEMLHKFMCSFMFHCKRLCLFHEMISSLKVGHTFISFFFHLCYSSD